MRNQAVNKRSRRSRGARPEIHAYLRDVEFVPLLDPKQEVEVAQKLDEAREALAALALELPEPLRAELASEVAGARAGRGWESADIRRFLDALERRVRERPSPELEASLREARRHKRRLDEAREALILANLRLVVFVARRYLHRGVPLPDLVQEGNIGLMRAVEKFDHRLGNKFSTYAYWWIQQAIDRALTVKWRTVRLPVHVVTAWRKICRAADRLEQQLGREPSPAEIAVSVRIPASKVAAIRAAVLDSREERQGDAAELDLIDRMAGEDAAAIDRRVWLRETRERVAETLDSLDPREAKVIRMRFGIGGSRASTLQEIGGMLNLSRERVRQIESEAMQKLRASKVLQAC